METENCVDLFAGPGGLSLGFEMARNSRGQKAFNLLMAVEKDPIACKTLRRNLADGENCRVLEGDLRDASVRSKIRRECAGKTDIVLAGPPCQSFSMIGPRSGNPGNMKVRDKYDSLYTYFVDVVASLKPSFIVFENVKGILSKRNGDARVIEIILKDLKKLGYDFGSENGSKDEYLVLNAADFGVPQIRHRVFLLGNRLGIPNPFPSATHYDPDDFSPNNPSGNNLLPYVTLVDAIGDLPRVRAKKTMTHVPAYRRREVEKYNGRVFSGNHSLEYNSELFREHIKKLGPSGKAFLEYVRNGAGETVTHHVARPQQESDIKLFAGMSPGSSSKDLMRRGDRRSKKLLKLIRYDMTTFTDKYKKHRWNRPSSTVFAHMRRDGNRFIHPDGRQARTFTPREAARIQSFPDSFFFEGATGKIFEQVGNAVPPLLAKAIACAILNKWRGS